MSETTTSTQERRLTISEALREAIVAKLTHLAAIDVVAAQL